MSAAAHHRTAPFVPDGLDLSLLGAVDGPLGLAVSGGGDSTALAVLLTELCPREYVVLTVDHGLRAGSAADADAAVALAQRLGLPAERLMAEGAPHGSLQDWARRTRHVLFRKAAARLGLAAIVLGHTLEDQAETFLLRLARGSGVTGLAGMAADTTIDGLRLLRPLLAVRREALRAALTSRKIAWREDPSNADPRFDRIAMRALLPRLAAAGIAPEAIARSCTHLRRSATAIEDAVRALLAAGRWDRAGAFWIDRNAWRAAPQEVRLRALSQTIQTIGRAQRTPDFAALIEADRCIDGGGATTLGHTQLDANGRFAVLWREARHLPAVTLAPSESIVFAGRYRVSAAAWAPAACVAPLGPHRPAHAFAVFKRALSTVPAIYADGTLIAVPSLGVRDRRLRPDTFSVVPRESPRAPPSQAPELAG